jgi:hypothetical protein
MVKDEKRLGGEPGENTPAGSNPKTGEQRPDWSDGLRQLYNSVVEEDIPDTFKDLLSQLGDDEGSGKGKPADTNPAADGGAPKRAE